MTRYLFSPTGQRAIADVLERRPLIAFDFDGTLAPIVSTPEQARTGLGVARAMARLCELAPVAVVTGRAIADVRERLGFMPRHIVGNHGAEQAGSAAPAAPDRWREALTRHAALFNAHGILVEDKQHSLTLHYRLAPDRAQAERCILEMVATLDPAPQVIGGKCVVNLLPADAPDKYQAIRRLLLDEGRSHAIFIGDDLTDEVVFDQAPPDWLTVRVEYRDQSRARFFLNAQSEVATFIQALSAGLLALPPERDWTGRSEP